ncbi:MAG TPA: flagellar basal body P-ring formation chaperone FlgA [Burkholderiales bacterium]|nr:flagellar basal body P-ring formation chaperone FlgA [Burkholderiales bacterium]
MSRPGALLAMLGCLAAASPCVLAGDDDALVNTLRRRFPEVKRIEVTPLSHPVSPVAELEIPGDIGLEKRVQTWVTTIGRDGKPHRTAQWWSLKAFAPVMVARRALRAGDPVRPADIAAEERDIAGSGGALLDADPGLADARWRATRFVQAGAPLRRADLEPAPEVLRGQQVRVNLVSGLFTIETTGIARDEGRLGAVIAVTRPGEPQPYFAEVTGEREVLVRGKP